MIKCSVVSAVATLSELDADCCEICNQVFVSYFQMKHPHAKPAVSALVWAYNYHVFVTSEKRAWISDKACLHQLMCSLEYGAFRHRVLHMENGETIQIRLLEESDPPSIAAAFKIMGWNKPETQYRRYLHEQVAGTRTCFVAIVDGQFAGYVTVNWRPAYAGFADLNIPEIQDLNVLTTYRRKGIASRLLDRAEGEAARRSGVVGIGVGLHPGYNAAQRLYVKRGYIPDARGITYPKSLYGRGRKRSA